jgi:hypothetical protein
MRDFVFVSKADSTLKATLRTDIIDEDFEKFTIMWWEGVKGTIFETYIPWKLGSVITMEDIENWCEKYQILFDGYKYGGDVRETLGSPLYDINITATVTNGAGTTIKLIGVKEGALGIEEEVELVSTVEKTVTQIGGYTYSFVLTEGDWTTTSPDDVTLNEDTDVALAITLPE